MSTIEYIKPWVSDDGADVVVRKVITISIIGNMQATLGRLGLLKQIR